jgi:uncharacterized membrane protein YeiH
MLIMVAVLVILIMVVMLMMLELLALVVLFWHCDAVGGLVDVVFGGDVGLNYCYNVYINPCSYGGVVGAVWW